MTKLDLKAADRDVFVRGDNAIGRIITIGQRVTSTDTVVVDTTNFSVSSGGALTMASHIQGVNVIATGAATVGSTLLVSGTSTMNGVVTLAAGASSPGPGGGSNNEIFGLDAGTSLTSGGQNMLFGKNAGANLTTASNNILYGYNAGTGIVAGNTNVALGANTITAVDGTDLVAIGDGALRYSEGANNTAIGKSAMSGDPSVAHTGEFNVAIGANAMQAVTGVTWNNIAIGARSLQAMTTAIGNLCIGKDTGLAITTGGSNIFIGNATGDDTTIGDSNILIGPGLTTTAVDTDYELKINFAGGSNVPIISGTMGPTATANVGKIGINTLSHNAMLNVLVDAADSIPVVELEQLSSSDAFINFKGTEAASTAEPISTLSTPGTLTKWARVEANGTTYWTPLYTNPS